MTLLNGIVGALWGAFVFIVAIPVLVLFAQVALARRPPSAAPPTTRRPTLTVLMPAHNESAGVAASIRSVLAQMQAGDSLLVVADNCTDDTAVVAAAAGAQVVQRTDRQLRGKGYALDFGVRHLQANPPEVLVIVDSDCLLAPGCLAHLASTAVQTGRPVQALYLMGSPAGAGLKTRLAELAWVVKNQVRPMGWWRVGLPCQLMGTGMAFPWPLISHVPLASGHIVEDMQLGLDLAANGTPPMFCPQALVSSSFPTDASGLASQRTRWEHGHLSVITSQGPRLLWRAVSRGRPKLLAMALDLCVPPLASLALMIIVCLAGGLVWMLLGAGMLAGAVSVLLPVIFSATVLLAWSRFGGHIVSFNELLSVPSYVVAKLPVYVRWFGKRQAEWVRTERDDGRRRDS